MSAVDEILAQIPLSQLAAQLGVDEQTAEQATRQALPALLGGMQANAIDPGGAASLTEALGQHKESSVLEGGVHLGQVDTAEGEQIVGHVFGDNQDEVVNRLGGLGEAGGIGAGAIQKLLPILAPIVMAWLAKRVTGGGAGTTADASQGGLGDILGNVLGGAAGGTSAAGAGGGDLGDILGGLLGGGRR